MSDATPSTREAILVAARHRFAEHGFQGASLNDIAGDVGIRRPSLLHHFASKEALYAEVFQATLAEWGDRVDDAVQADEHGWKQVDRAITAGFGFFYDNPDFVRILRREALDRNLGIDLGAALRPFLQRAEAWFESEIDAGRFRRVDVEQLLITGYSVISTYFADVPFLEGLLDEDPLALEAVEARARHLKNLFHVALSPTAP